MRLFEKIGKATEGLVAMNAIVVRGADKASRAREFQMICIYIHMYIYTFIYIIHVYIYHSLSLPLFLSPYFAIYLDMYRNYVCI